MLDDKVSAMQDDVSLDFTLSELKAGYIVHSFWLEEKADETWETAPMRQYFVRSLEVFGDIEIAYLVPLNAFRSPPLDPYPVEDVISKAYRIQVTRSSPDLFETGQAYRVFGTIPGTLVEYFKVRAFTDEGVLIDKIGGNEEDRRDTVSWAAICHRVCEKYEP